MPFLQKSALIVFLMSVLLCNYSVSQHYSFRSLTMDDGLSNFVVTSFFKDSRGFMWIGTDNCLDRFDGVTIRHFPFHQGDINRKRVKSIIESADNQLYAGNGMGLWRVNEQARQMEQVFANEIDCEVHVLYREAGESVLYVGSEKGLFWWEPDNQLQFLPLDKNVLSQTNAVTGITSDKEGLLWLATKNGLVRLDPRNLQTKVFYNGATSSFHKITRIATTLYMGTSNSGVHTFSIDSQKFGKTVGLGSDIITDLSSDTIDRLYVATDGNGVHFISHSGQQIIQSLRYNPRQQDGIRSNSVYSLLVDKDGIVWIGFYQAGVDYSLFQNRLFTTYSFPPFFDSAGLPVRSFFIRNNEKLIGTREGLYYINEQQNLVANFTRNDLRSNLVLSLHYYHGEYYIGTYGGGASVLNPANRKVRPFQAGLVFEKGHVFHFEEDRDGNLWMATSGGVVRYSKRNNELTVYDSSNSPLPGGNVFYIFFDSTGKGWIATEKGLYIYDPVTKAIHADKFPTGFFNKEIIKLIYEDTANRLFFCPDKGNIWVSDLHMREFSPLGMTNRFQGRIFLSVIEDARQTYWFGSDNGLISMQADEDAYHSFGFMDGIPDPVFNTDAAYRDEEGRLWFGNAKGLLYVDPEQVNTAKQQFYPIQFTGLLVNGEEASSELMRSLTGKKTVRLSYLQNNITFQFVNLVYSQPSTLVYEYKLEGHDAEWKLLSGGQHEVRYSNLNAGNYVFKVRAEGNKESEAVLNVHIQSFFTLTFWLIALVVAVVLYFFASQLYRLYKRLMNKVISLSSGSSAAAAERNEEKYKNLKLGDDECKLLYANVEQLMAVAKPFINPELKLADLASALNVSSSVLSYFFNQYLNKSYYDFVNEYRIGEFKRIVNDTADISRYTLSALAEQCGFSSRASFFRSFKKLTGITPNEFIRSVGKSAMSGD